MFLVAAIVFPQSIYCNIKSKYADAIQNNNKKRFVIYLKMENGCFSEKEIWKAWFRLRLRGRWKHTSTRLQYRWLNRRQKEMFSHLIML